jgi:hypothetical protein
MTRTEAIAKLEAAVADLRRYPEGSYFALQAEWSAIVAMEKIAGTDWCEARELVGDALLTEHSYCVDEGSFVDDDLNPISEHCVTMLYDGSRSVRECVA